MFIYLLQSIYSVSLVPHQDITLNGYVLVTFQVVYCLQCLSNMFYTVIKIGSRDTVYMEWLSNTIVPIISGCTKLTKFQNQMLKYLSIVKVWGSQCEHTIWRLSLPYCFTESDHFSRHQSGGHILLRYISSLLLIWFQEFIIVYALLLPGMAYHHSKECLHTVISLATIFTWLPYFFHSTSLPCCVYQYPFNTRHRTEEWF